MDYC
jgi:hypothetical protein